MSLTVLSAERGTQDRRAYWRAYYLANRERKIEQAKASYRRRVAAKRAAKPRKPGAPRFYATRGL